MLSIYYSRRTKYNVRCDQPKNCIIHNAVILSLYRNSILTKRIIIYLTLFHSLPLPKNIQRGNVDGVNSLQEKNNVQCDQPKKFSYTQCNYINTTETTLLANRIIFSLPLVLSHSHSLSLTPFERLFNKAT